MMTFGLYGAFRNFVAIAESPIVLCWQRDMKWVKVFLLFCTGSNWGWLVSNVRLSLYWNGSLVTRGLIVLGNVLPFYNQCLLSAMANV